MSHTDVPVLIVGGGASGLSSSIALSRLGVEHVMIERHPTTAHAPKAHILNQRTMEFFRQLGFDDRVYETGNAGKYLQTATWRTTLGGDAIGDAQAFAKIACWGGGKLEEEMTAISPSPPCSCHQIKLEPLLHEYALASSGDAVRFNTELIDFEERDGGVFATTRDRASGEEHTIQARYVIAADAGRTIGPKVGVTMNGSHHLQDNVSMHFTADFSDYLDDGTILNWMMNTSSAGAFGLASGVLVPVDRGRDSREWVLHFGFPPDAVEVDAELLAEKARELLKLPGHPIEVHQVNHWVLENILADKFRVGPYFFIGDAAHRHPPTIGIGMNSAYGDMSNIVWKLAMVVKGLAGEGLLDTYEVERQPTIARNMDCASTTYFSHMLVPVALGLMPGMDDDARKAAFNAFFEDSAEGERKRARAQEMIEGVLRMEFQATGLELGYGYESSAVVFDEAGREYQPDPTGCNYTPLSGPGNRVPHVWLSDGRSTLDLVGSFERFGLIAGPEGAAWVAGAEEAARQLGVPLHAEVLNAEAWSKIPDVTAAGALLVRPDNHIAFRSKTAPSNAQQQITDALATVLSLPEAS